MPTMTFADFVPGTVLGNDRFTVDAWWLAQWAIAVPGAAPSPGAIAMALAMRSYLSILRDRTPGNIHARQQLSVRRAVTAGDTVMSTLTCESTELRNERRRVVLAVTACDVDGDAFFEARMTILWAR